MAVVNKEMVVLVNKGEENWLAGSKILERELAAMECRQATWLIAVGTRMLEFHYDIASNSSVGEYTIPFAMRV